VRVDLGADVPLDLQAGRPPAAVASQQLRARARPALVREHGVQALPPAGAVVAQRLTQPRLVAQPLDVLRRQPGAGQHLLGQQQRHPARIKAIGLRSPPAALEREHLAGITPAHVDADGLQLAADPPVASIATAATRSCQLRAHAASSSRSAAKRSSAIPPDRGSSTAARMTCLWMLRPGGRLQVADVVINTEVSEDARKRIDLWTG
jgi:hypothetical protein